MKRAMFAWLAWMGAAWAQLPPVQEITTITIPVGPMLVPVPREVIRQYAAAQQMNFQVAPALPGQNSPVLQMPPQPVNREVNVVAPPYPRLDIATPPDRTGPFRDMEQVPDRTRQGTDYTKYRDRTTQGTDQTKYRDITTQGSDSYKYRDHTTQGTDRYKYRDRTMVGPDRDRYLDRTFRRDR